MKFSEVMREGIKKTEGQSYRQFVVRSSDTAVKVCAMGSGFLGAGMVDASDVEFCLPPDVSEQLLFRARVLWPVLERHVPCPCGGCRVKEVSLLHTIMHLNDSHTWAIERIADWLEQKYEPEDATAIREEPQSVLEPHGV